MGNGTVDRRRFLGAALCACAISPRLGLSHMQLGASLSESLTKEQRDSMTPSQIIDELKKGNERFRSGKMVPTRLPGLETVKRSEPVSGSLGTWMP